jgi:spermidine synthase
MTPKTLNWQNSHLQALKDQLNQLKDQPNDYLYYEPIGIHFVMVEKSDHLIRLVLIDQVNLSSKYTQSALDLNDPFQPVLPYIKGILLALLWQNDPQNIYLAGLGGGIIPLFFYHYFPDTVITCSEIDASLINIASKFFGLNFDERLNVKIEDGRNYLHQTPPEQKYDLIIIDVCLGNGYMPYNLATVEFYQLCQHHLSSTGVIVINLFAKDPYLWEKIATINHCFQFVYLCPFEEGNYVIIANNHQILNQEQILDQAQQQQQTNQFSFSLIETAQQLQLLPDHSHFQEQIKNLQPLRDDHPPETYFEQLPCFDTFFAKPAPNAPCPCGSGKPFAHCHGMR